MSFDGWQIVSVSTPSDSLSKKTVFVDTVFLDDGSVLRRLLTGNGLLISEYSCKNWERFLPRAGYVGWSQRCESRGVVHENQLILNERAELIFLRFFPLLDEAQIEINFVETEGKGE